MKENKKRTIALVAKVFGGIAFLSVFLLNVLVFHHKDGKTADVSVGLLNAFAQTQGEGPGGGSKGTSTVVTKKVTTYYKFTVSAGWIVVKTAAEAQRTEETDMTYTCCLSGTPPCAYTPCDQVH
jgi:hypothetical protein